MVNPKVPKELRKKYETVVFAGAISAAGEFSNLTVLGGDQVFANIALDAFASGVTRLQSNTENPLTERSMS